MEKIFSQIDKFIEDGNDILEKQEIQRFDFWKDRVEKYLSDKVSEDIVKKYSGAGWLGRIPTRRDDMNRIKIKELGKKVRFLKTLKEEMQTHPEYYLSSEVGEKANTESDINKLFDMLKLHPIIIKSSEKVFKDGHYSEAIFNAFRAIEYFVKQKSGINNSGQSLMSDAFNINLERNKIPILKLNELKTEFDRDEQKGFHQIFRGVMEGIRNVKAHKEIIQDDPYKTLEYLSMASLLAKRVDEAELNTEQ